MIIVIIIIITITIIITIIVIYNQFMYYTYIYIYIYIVFFWGGASTWELGPGSGLWAFSVKDCRRRPGACSLQAIV